MRRLSALMVLVVALTTPVWGHGHKVIRIDWTGFNANTTASLTAPVRGFFVMEGKSNLGPVSGLGVAGKFAQNPIMAPPWCSGLFYPLDGNGEIGIRFAATGELLVVNTVPHPDSDLGACYDPAAGKMDGHVTGIVVSGTGRFEGATGTLDLRFTLRYAPPPAGNALILGVQKLVVKLD